LAEPNKPFFLELAGLPAAGKTTAAELLRERFVRLGLRVSVIPEQAAHSPLVKLKRDWRFNAWTLCMVVADTLALAHDSGSDVLIVDRGLVDALCWFAWYRKNGELSTADADVLCSFAKMPEWFRRIGMVIVLKANYATALARRGKTGRILNPLTFKELDAAYEEALRGLTALPTNPRIECLWTDQRTPSEVFDWMIDRIRESRILKL
jgi:thymidylate kinase